MKRPWPWVWHSSSNQCWLSSGTCYSWQAWLRSLLLAQICWFKAVVLTAEQCLLREVAVGVHRVAQFSLSLWSCAVNTYPMNFPLRCRPLQANISVNLTCWYTLPDTLPSHCWHARVSDRLYVHVVYIQRPRGNIDHMDALMKIILTALGFTNRT